MKKVIAVSCLVLAMVTMLTACGKFECEMCGKESKGKKYKQELLGQEYTCCESCNEKYEALQGIGDSLSDLGDNLGGLFG